MCKKRIKGGRKFNERMERTKAERERLRPEGPAPDYPPALPHLWIVVGDFDSGDVVRHEIRLYRSDRADCYVAEVDGEHLPRRMGWAQALGLDRKAFVRVRAF